VGLPTFRPIGVGEGGQGSIGEQANQRGAFMTMFRKAAAAAAGFFAAMVVAGGAALAQQNVPGVAGAPFPWQSGFQEAASPVMREIVGFHSFLTVLITVIAIFVLALLVYIIWRFNARSNPVPSKNSHNTVLEVVWTVIPVAILVIMAIPSFRILYHADTVPDAARVREMYGINVAGTIDIKATGNQWFWSYEYPEQRIMFDSFCGMGPIEGACFEQPGPEGAPANRPRLLETTEHVVVPVNTLIRVLVTAADVIHAWAVPAMGVKIDGVPGRANQTWFVAEREGTFFGQCSELCGQGHGYMPITVEVVSRARYDQWVTSKRAELGLPPLEENLRFAAN
jgi:cytochrome c oxidase subunit II